LLRLNRSQTLQGKESRKVVRKAWAGTAAEIAKLIMPPSAYDVVAR
jgi:hypothetical protein